MAWIRTVLREVFGLFADDANFAITILAWLLVVWLALPRFGLESAWRGIILFAGLALILVENATRRARQQVT